MKLNRRDRPAPHIPFISLADIAWQIIIFFLVASAFTHNEAMKVDVPNSAPQAPSNSGAIITLQATETALAVNGKPVPLPDLQGRLAGLLAGKKTDQDRAVLVEGRDDLTFQRDVDIMYAIQKAGGVAVMAEDDVAGPAGQPGQAAGAGGQP